MGLLSKAAERAVPDHQKLDEMGQALLDRIKRLPPRKTTPYTALSLLKAYASFPAGACLALRRGVYTSYASVGMGVEKLVIPKEIICSDETAGKPFAKLGSTGELLLKSVEKGLPFWVFPLDRDKTWGAVIILGDNNNSNFDPEAINTIIQGALEIFNPQIDKILMRNSSDYYPINASDPVETAIAQYFRVNSQFNGIVLDIPAGMADEDRKKLNKAVSDMVALIGSTIVLPSQRSLVLLPRPVDKELIAHRLSNSLKTKTLLVFEAGNPGEALQFIRAYL